jgi:small conductance mechanosensitive channel
MSSENPVTTDKPETLSDIIQELPHINVENLTSVEGAVQEFSQLNHELMQLFITLGGRIVTAIFILIICWMIGNWIAKKMRNLKRIDNTLKEFLARSLKYLVVVIGVVTVIGLFGIPMASLLAVLGAAGLAIGLALQGTLANVAAGVMLLILRPFNVGDYITWGNEGGTVKTLGLFGTELAMADNVYIFAPNSKIWGNEIRNFSRNMLRRQDIAINISYGDDINKVFQTIHAVLAADERVLKTPDDKKPQVMTDNMADYSVTVIARLWCKNSDYWGLRYDLIKEIKETLEREGITIPLTTRQLTLGTEEQK